VSLNTIVTFLVETKFYRRSVRDFGGELCAMKLVGRNPLCPAVLQC